MYFDGVFGSELTKKYREEIKFLYENNLLYLNKTYYDGKITELLVFTCQESAMQRESLSTVILLRNQMYLS